MAEEILESHKDEPTVFGLSSLHSLIQKKVNDRDCTSADLRSVLERFKCERITGRFGLGKQSKLCMDRNQYLYATKEAVRELEKLENDQIKEYIKKIFPK